MRLFLILPLLFVLFGCSSTPQRPQNTECLQVANYARTIATLKDMGIKEHELSHFTYAPTAVTFPFRRIQEEVYNTNGETPAHVFVQFYDKCDLMGYSVLLHTLNADQRERIERKKAEEREKELERIRNVKPIPTKIFLNKKKR